MEQSSSNRWSSSWPQATAGRAAVEAEQDLVVCALDASPQLAAQSPLRRRQIAGCAAMARARADQLGLSRPSSAAELEFKRDRTATTDAMRLVSRHLSLANEMGVTVISVPWPDDHLRGLYLDDAGLIALNAQLRAFQLTETLTHELIHAAYRDRRSTVWTESRAEAAGAMLCLDLVAIRRCRTDTAHGRALWSAAGVLDRQRSAVSHLVCQRVEGW
jgi:hypothetical protein